MRSRLNALVPLLALAALPLAAEDAKKCLDLRAERDREGPIARGVQVAVYARNSCSEDFAGRNVRFKVTVRSRGEGIAGTQNGRFQGTIAGGGSADTKVFVECDPDRAGAVEVELLD